MLRLICRPLGDDDIAYDIVYNIVYDIVYNIVYDIVYDNLNHIVYDIVLIYDIV